MHALSPLGGYKGQGLAMAVTLLAALLTGAPGDWHLASVGAGTPGRGREIGHLLICLDDPRAFGSAEAKPYWFPATPSAGPRRNGAETVSPGTPPLPPRCC